MASCKVCLLRWSTWPNLSAFSLKPCSSGWCVCARVRACLRAAARVCKARSEAWRRQIERAREFMQRAGEGKRNGRGPEVARQAHACTLHTAPVTPAMQQRDGSFTHTRAHTHTQAIMQKHRWTPESYACLPPLPDTHPLSSASPCYTSTAPSRARTLGKTCALAKRRARAG